MRSFYREKQIYHGNYLDVDIYPVFVDGRCRGSRRKKANPTSEVQAKLNEKYANLKNVHLINSNFTMEDLVVTLTYAPHYLPGTEEEAIKDLKNFLRRLRRALKKLGKDLKYFAVYEQSKNGRHHHHIIISGGLSPTEIQKLWGYGIVDTKALYFDEYGVTALTQYITKETSSKKKIIHSRNLVNPIEKQRDGKISKKKAMDIHNYNVDAREVCKKLYPEYELADMNPFYNEVNGHYYISLRLYKPEIFKKRKRRTGVAIEQ